MKKIFILLLALFLITGCGSKKEEFESTNMIVPSFISNVSNDNMWCGTFQLVWNDLKNELVHRDIEIDSDMVRNLNLESFTQYDISDDRYYKVYGEATKELKETIEQNLKEKFDQKTEILNNFEWNGNLILYSMLYRQFEFENGFEKLSSSNFGKYEKVNYFGISSTASEELRSQVRILFYDDDDHFAISIRTKNNDEIIMYKNPIGESFQHMYDEVRFRDYSYNGNRNLVIGDEFKAPIISVKKLREYKELENQKIDADGKEYIISKAIQTIEFSLNEKGLKLSSEAGLDLRYEIDPNMPKKKLYLNDTFALFLKEEGKERPYFAAKITDITKFTKN